MHILFIFPLEVHGISTLSSSFSHQNQRRFDPPASHNYSHSILPSALPTSSLQLFPYPPFSSSHIHPSALPISTLQLFPYPPFSSSHILPSALPISTLQLLPYPPFSSSHIHPSALPISSLLTLPVTPPPHTHTLLLLPPFQPLPPTPSLLITPHPPVSKGSDDESPGVAKILVAVVEVSVGLSDGAVVLLPVQPQLTQPLKGLPAAAATLQHLLDDLSSMNLTTDNSVSRSTQKTAPATSFIRSPLLLPTPPASVGPVLSSSHG